MTQSTVFGAVPAGSGQQVLDDLNLSDQALATEHEGTSAPSETQPGEIRMSGDFQIGHAGDLTGIDPDDCADLKLVVRRYCRWYKGVAATTTGLTGGTDPEDDTAYPLLAGSTDDGPGKRLVIRDIIFEGDLATTQKWLGDASRLIALANYDVELVDVEGRWGSETGFHLSYCDQVRAARVYLNRIAANGLDASNCADVAVTDSDFAWMTPAEIADLVETELRSFSPKDIADIVAAVLAS